MSQKPRGKRKQKTKQTITRTVTHIRLSEANPGKLEALDAVVSAFLALCQQYVTHFCTEADPNKYAAPRFETPLSQRWQRVAIQQAAGIAQSWHTNRAKAYEAYLEELADFEEVQASPHPDPTRKRPTWKEWRTPELRVPVVQANANVVVLEPSEDSTFDYWLRISTLEKRHPLRIPVRLSSYHHKALAFHTINTSTTLHKRKGVWWLSLSCDEDVPLHTDPSAPTVGVDVGIATFLTTSTGQQYGSFHGKLRSRQKRDREKRRRKAKLRACLKKKGVKHLPSSSSASSQRLARHVRQEINYAVNQMLAAHAFETSTDVG